jgi:hypothetical protein
MDPREEWEKIEAGDINDVHISDNFVQLKNGETPFEWAKTHAPINAKTISGTFTCELTPYGKQLFDRFACEQFATERIEAIYGRPLSSFANAQAILNWAVEALLRGDIVLTTVTPDGNGGIASEWKRFAVA